ncbi:hypothetical protein ACHAXA_006051 [Cyclostephanos tholiformis]|uniref:Thioredoxin domain-containing protein n=1 Tax=Cyclostephanos tholiformis TaxID=382380 RepID=A0ABD3R5S6_9STRA
MASSSSSSSAVAIELTPANFHEVTDDKTVFIKFFAPWCGHCQSIEDDWNALAADFDGDTSGQLVAEVDCTADGESLCSEFGITGYPTLKWGDPSDLRDYDGGRSYEEMRRFADENLKPQCSIKNLDICDDDRRALIVRYLDMSVDELSAMADAEEGKLREAEGRFHAEVEKLHARYGELSKEKDDVIAGIKMAGFGLMKSVLRSM